MDKKGRIQVPGMYKDVAEVTEEEQQLYEKIEFDLGEYCKDVGVSKLLHSTKASRAVGVRHNQGQNMNLNWNRNPDIELGPGLIDQAWFSDTHKESDAGLKALSMY